MGALGLDRQGAICELCQSLWIQKHKLSVHLACTMLFHHEQVQGLDLTGNSYRESPICLGGVCGRDSCTGKSMGFVLLCVDSVGVAKVQHKGVRKFI